jgi:hypothetical protein
MENKFLIMTTKNNSIFSCFVNFRARTSDELMYRR